MVHELRSYQMVQQMLDYTKDMLQPQMIQVQELNHREMQEKSDALQALRMTIEHEEMSKQAIMQHLSRNVESEQNDLPALTGQLAEYEAVLNSGKDNLLRKLQTEQAILDEETAVARFRSETEQRDI